MDERRWPHILRLGVFAAFLLTLFYLVAVARVVDVRGVRDAVAATGPVAPLAYLAASAVLAAIFVPGPLLAAGSGFLFGPVLGTFVTLGSTVTTATIAALIGPAPGPVTTDDPMAVLSAAVTALLGPERASQKQIRSAATEIIDFLRTGQAAALHLIDPPRSRG